MPRSVPEARLPAALTTSHALTAFWPGVPCAPWAPWAPVAPVAPLAPVRPAGPRWFQVSAVSPRLQRFWTSSSWLLLLTTHPWIVLVALLAASAYPPPPSSAPANSATLSWTIRWVLGMRVLSPGFTVPADRRERAGHCRWPRKRSRCWCEGCPAPWQIGRAHV